MTIPKGVAQLRRIAGAELRSVQGWAAELAGDINGADSAAQLLANVQAELHAIADELEADAVPRTAAED